MFLPVDAQPERAGEHVDEFAAGMMVRPLLAVRDRVELRQIAVEASLGGREVERLEVIRRVTRTLALWKPQPVAAAHDADGRLFAHRGEEVVEAEAEHER